jgi:hypothetical protein
MCKVQWYFAEEEAILIHLTFLPGDTGKNVIDLK